MSYIYNEKMSEGANIACALYAIANELNRLGLGDAATHMGAIESHSVAMKEAFGGIASSLDGISNSLDQVSNSIDGASFKKD